MNVGTKRSGMHVVLVMMVALVAMGCSEAEDAAGELLSGTESSEPTPNPTGGGFGFGTGGEATTTGGETGGEGGAARRLARHSLPVAPADDCDEHRGQGAGAADDRARRLPG